MTRSVDSVITAEQLRDAKELIKQLKRVPKDSYEKGRLLTIGFMSGLEASEMSKRPKDFAQYFHNA